MKKKNKNDDSLTECPVCNSPVMNKNLSRHLSKVHSIDKVDDVGEDEKIDESLDLELDLDDEIYLIKEDLRIYRRQRNIVSLLFVVMIILLPVTYAITAPPGETSVSQSQSSSSNEGLILAPDFLAVDVVTGEPVTLSQLKGSTILLNFVNYGCDQRTNEVVSEQLLLIKDLKEQRDDFIPLSVFCGCCPEETLRNFATENGLSWPWVLDSDYSVVQDYIDYVRSYGYPTLVFINKDQYIVDFGGFYDASTLSAMLDSM